MNVAIYFKIAVIVASMDLVYPAPSQFPKEKAKDDFGSENFGSTLPEKIPSQEPEISNEQDRNRWINLLRSKPNLLHQQNRRSIAGNKNETDDVDEKIPRFEYSRQAFGIDPCPTVERTDKLYTAFRSSTGSRTISIRPFVATRRICSSSTPITTVNEGNSYCAPVRTRHRVPTTNGNFVHGHFEHECKLFIRTKGLVMQRQVGDKENESSTRPFLGNMTCTSDIIVISSLAFSALCLLSCFYRNKPGKTQS
ncbi:uncharacterized protein LOC144428353 [Styela clava]